MEVVDRLFEFMAANGLSQNEFEKRCGLPHSNLKAMKQGPTSAYLVRIATNFPDLDFNWLIRGAASGEAKAINPKISLHDIHDNQVVSINYLQDAIRDAILGAYREITGK